MPTYEAFTRFWNDFAKLDPKERAAFLDALAYFIDDLRLKPPRFRPSLRVKRVQGVEGVFEMSWAPDGRATFSYGIGKIPGEPHIIWRRIGTHRIFENP